MAVATMSTTDADSQVIPLLNTLRNPSDTISQLAALRQLKHRLIGHDQRKLAYVNLGFLEPLVAILERNDGQHCLDCKTEAAIVVGSLAHGNTALLPEDQTRRVVASLLDSLSLQKSGTKFVQASLRTLNTIFSLPNTSNAPDLIAQLQAHPSFLRNISTVMNGKNTDSMIFTLAASLIANTCSQGDQRWQDRLVETKILAALVKKLAMFVKRIEEGKLGRGFGTLRFDRQMIDRTALSKVSSSVSLKSMTRKLPEPLRPEVFDPFFVPSAPSTLQIATLLDAISVIVRDSKIRSNQVLFAGWITNLLGEEARPEIGDPNYQPKDAMQGAETLDMIIPQTAAASTYTYRNQEFPPLASPPPQRTHHRSQSAVEMSTTVSYHSGVAETEIDPPSPVTKLMFTADGESDPESPLIPWLISFIRKDSNPLNRLHSMNLLTNFVRAGCVTKARAKMISLLIVPILVRLLDEPDGAAPTWRKLNVTGAKAQEIEWTIRERAPTILATLVTDNQEMQKASVEAGAIRRLTGMLRRAFDAVPNMENGDNTNGVYPSNAGADTVWIERCKEHKMKVREGTLKALAAIALFEDEYRKLIIDGGAVPFVVGSMVPSPKDMERADMHMPDTTIGSTSHASDAADGNTSVNAQAMESTPNSNINLPPTSADGNPASVLTAASNVVRSLSRSVSILRTSLIDYHVSKPLYKLLFHPSIRVKIAATAAICNLVMAFSPMRKGIVEMGVVEVLCGFIKTPHDQEFDPRVEDLRLNSMWALKHLVLETTLDVKRDCLEKLDATYLVDLIAKDANEVTENISDVAMAGETAAEGVLLNDNDRDMDANLSKHNGIPFSPASFERLGGQLHKISSVAPAQKALLELQEQALDFIRNLIVPPNSAPMIDHLLDNTEKRPNNFYGVLEQKLRSELKPKGKPHVEIVHSIVYILVHIAAAQPRHRDALIKRESLFHALNSLFRLPMDQVRSGLSWLGINLTWVEDAGDQQNAKDRIKKLEEYGFVKELRWLRKYGDEYEASGGVSSSVAQAHADLLGGAYMGMGGTGVAGRLSRDVRERCRQALSQIDNGST